MSMLTFLSQALAIIMHTHAVRFKVLDPVCAVFMMGVSLRDDQLNL